MAAAPALLSVVSVEQQGRLAAELNQDVDRLNELLQKQHTLERRRSPRSAVRSLSSETR